MTLSNSVKSRKVIFSRLKTRKKSAFETTKLNQYRAITFIYRRLNLKWQISVKHIDLYKCWKLKLNFIMISFLFKCCLEQTKLKIPKSSWTLDKEIVNYPWSWLLIVFYHFQSFFWPNLIFPNYLKIAEKDRISSSLFDVVINANEQSISSSKFILVLIGYNGGNKPVRSVPV